MVRGDHAARAIRQHRFAQVLDDLVLVPAVVGFLQRQGIESSRHIRRRPSTLEGLVTDKAAWHAQTLRVVAALVNPVVGYADYCIATAILAWRAVMGETQRATNARSMT